MIRVVADTNIFVSAIVFGGTCEEVLTLARAGIVEIFVSPAIRSELRTVLAETFGWRAYQVREALAEIDSITSPVRPRERLSGITAHDPDHRILEAAMAADADYLVTGDRRHLQRLQEFRDTRIVSPREFLDLLNR